MASIAAQTTVAPGRTGSRLRAVVKGAREAPLVAIVILGGLILVAVFADLIAPHEDRKSTRLNSSHVSNSYAVFCLKKKTPARADDRRRPAHRRERRVRVRP